jgi:PAS domain-containing protein
LVKPFSARELLARVGAHLQMARLRREANELLRESEERLQIALDTGKLSSWQLDFATLHMDCTAQCKANYGLPPDSLFSYERLCELIHPDDREQVNRRSDRPSTATPTTTPSTVPSGRTAARTGSSPEAG